MIIKNIKLIKETKFNQGRILALDFGTKRFGFAISDGTQTIATPLTNHNRKENLEQDLAFIANLIKIHDISTIIVGLPTDFNNDPTKTTERVKSFTNHLDKFTDMNIFYWNERYSSKAAEQVAMHKEFKNDHDDKIAATLILQGLLDYKNS